MFCVKNHLCVKAVLVNYVVGGWECFFIYTKKYNSPLTLSWFLEDYHFFYMDGSMTAMSLPLSLLVSVHRKNEVGRLISHLDNPAWISNLSVFLSRNMGSHLGLLIHKKEKHIVRCLSLNLFHAKKIFLLTIRLWTGCIPQMLKWVWGWHSHHLCILKSVSPEVTTQTDVPTVNPAWLQKTWGKLRAPT